MTSNDDENGLEAHHRRNRRSLMLLVARIRIAGKASEVHLRNLSQNGALLEADSPPPEGTEVVFERGETFVRAQVAWVSNRRFGIAFRDPIEESEVLIHVGRPKRVVPEPQPVYRRTGFRDQNLTAAEQKIAADWVQSKGTALGD